MAKLGSQSDFSKIEDLKEFVRGVSAWINEITPIVNGKIEFDQNIRSQTLDVTFPTANTDLRIGHRLNKTGVKFLVSDKDVACDVYRGVGADTVNQIYLRSTVANATVTLILI